MKPADQLKVIALAFVSIIVMIGVITAVSIKTTEAVASHGGGHGTETHSTESSEHAAPAADHSAPEAGEHGSEAKPAEQGHEAAPAEHGTESKPAEHSSESKPAEHASDTKAGEHATEAKSAEHATEAKPAANKGETHTATASGGNVEAGAKVFMTKTCATCHTVKKVKAAGTIGPKLDGLGATAAKRIAGTSAEDYIKQSIEDPNAFVVEGFTKGLMPPLRTTLSDQEFKDLVAFLGSL